MNRDRFPGLADGWARLDAPGGSQPVDVAIEAMSDWMRSGGMANQGGEFLGAERVDSLMLEARAAVGELLGGDPRGVVFGPSMTALTLSLPPPWAVSSREGTRSCARGSTTTRTSRRG